MGNRIIEILDSSPILDRFFHLLERLIVEVLDRVDRVADFLSDRWF